MAEVQRRETWRQRAPAERAAAAGGGRRPAVITGPGLRFYSPTLFSPFIYFPGECPPLPPPIRLPEGVESKSHSAE